ncbi:MAG: VOC family protein [Anaerolineae bacterium]|nr:VOC family protein [Anaerolineae bacterium]
MNNAINWFEIPSLDIDRAVKFYDTILDITLRRENFMGTPHAIFPANREQDGVAGAVIQSDARPSKDGAVLYLNTGTESNMEAALTKTPAAGGSVVLPKTSIGPMGWIAVIVDTEGNRVGLHCEAA